MTRVYPLAALSIILLTACSPRVAPPANLAVPSAGFSIWMPAELERAEYPEDIVLLAQTVPCTSYFARTSGVYWLVRYCNLSPDLNSNGSGTEIIDDAKGFLLQEAQGRLEIIQDLMVQGAIARRMTANSALRAGTFDGSHQALVVIRGQRLYLASTYGFDGADEEDLETMGQFIDSFALMDGG